MASEDRPLVPVLTLSVSSSQSKARWSKSWRALTSQRSPAPSAFTKQTNFLGHVKESYIRSAFHDSGSLSDQPSSVGQRIWAATSLRVYSTETFKNSNRESTPCTQKLR